RCARPTERLESRHARPGWRPDTVRGRADRPRARRARRAVGRRARAGAGGRARGRGRARADRPTHRLCHGPADVARGPEAARGGAPPPHGTALPRDGAPGGAGARGLERCRGNRSDRRAALTTSGDSHMPLAPQSFLYRHDRHTGVATITLNRPDRLNALTFDVYRELRDTFRTLDDEPGVRAVIITGTGRAFCSGGDVEDIIGALFARDEAGLLEFTRLTCDLILAMRQCRRPIVGALNGTVAGAGAVIAAACDVRVAAESAKIAFLFTKVGRSGGRGIPKDALNREAHMDLVTALEAEARGQAGCMLSPNFRAAYEAFKAKHEPKFV